MALVEIGVLLACAFCSAVILQESGPIAKEYTRASQYGRLGAIQGFRGRRGGNRVFYNFWRADCRLVFEQFAGPTGLWADLIELCANKLCPGQKEGAETTYWTKRH